MLHKCTLKCDKYQLIFEFVNKKLQTSSVQKEHATKKVRPLPRPTIPSRETLPDKLPRFAPSTKISKKEAY